MVMRRCENAVAIPAPSNCAVHTSDSPQICTLALLRTIRGMFAGDESVVVWLPLNPKDRRPKTELCTWCLRLGARAPHATRALALSPSVINGCELGSRFVLPIRRRYDRDGERYGISRACFNM